VLTVKIDYSVNQASFVIKAQHVSGLIGDFDSGLEARKILFPDRTCSCDLLNTCFPAKREIKVALEMHKEKWYPNIANEDRLTSPGRWRKSSMEIPHLQVG
jgi:hypothetical protein